MSLTPDPGVACRRPALAELAPADRARPGVPPEDVSRDIEALKKAAREKP
jgi:hypothetical protein